jgi:hypothetical protein
MTMRSVFLWAGLGVTVAAGGCNDNRCGAPDEVTYTSCQPINDPTQGCLGSPSRDPAKAKQILPRGCEVRFPECLQAYPDSVRTCYCGSPLPMGQPQWSCGI